MNLAETIEKAAAEATEPAIKHHLMMTVHVLRYPMTTILAKVPGDTLKERAERIGVSRQTMYVWAHEKFRPSLEQAVIISDLTDIPVWQIRDLQVDYDYVGEARARSRVVKKRVRPPKRNLAALIRRRARGGKP